MREASKPTSNLHIRREWLEAGDRVIVYQPFPYIIWEYTADRPMVLILELHG